MIRERVGVSADELRERAAYRSGWHDGRFGQEVSFVQNPRLAEWEDLDRLAYYYGHREGRRIRQLLRGAGARGGAV
ncbi:hypothetical protein Rxyl_2203 [Rubrobacter xylanophilus DSM 9941]|uniref:Uncharacterized protein n=1 Tax=Rubrobacter xylanophilus (strain DSM 9941 / JCM 11954 / NBRC 16129 / PRD-1) TaxID=266117 RepID=Q1ATY2_RUBXD|nr:hypothetical protein Rxyl_2203 [Rubrobacter xylanophilus DSM 9941]